MDDAEEAQRSQGPNLGAPVLSGQTRGNYLAEIYTSRALTAAIVAFLMPTIVIGIAISNGVRALLLIAWVGALICICLFGVVLSALSLFWTWRASAAAQYGQESILGARIFAILLAVLALLANIIPPAFLLWLQIGLQGLGK